MARISKEEQAKVRQKILTIASKKFTDEGFENVSTKQIAKEVGIAEGTLFNYFDSKTHLFLEVFGEQFVIHADMFQYDFDPTSDIVDMIYDHVYRLMKLIIKIPKRILSELMIASIKLSKKHPKQFKKFVELDFKYMEELQVFLDDLQGRSIIKDVDTKELSELIYSIVMFEFIMYLYDQGIETEIMLQHIKSKLHILLKNYCTGGSHGN